MFRFAQHDSATYEMRSKAGLMIANIVRDLTRHAGR